MTTMPICALKCVETPSLRLGVSRCLLGEHCRWDGGHKLDPYLVDRLGQFIEWVPVCPEVELGLGVPRESLRLAGSPDAPRFVTRKSGIDHTEAMQNWARRRLEELAPLGLHGYVLKKDSPSCGMFRVRVYGKGDTPANTGQGIYARELAARFPLLPVEEEGRLHDPKLRENFIERIFVEYRWQKLLAEEPSPGGLVRFHTAHKMTLMAHAPAQYREMGRLVAQAGSLPWEKLALSYDQLLHATLAKPATPAKHSDVLQHLMGFLKHELDATDKEELLGLIADYRAGLAPLIVPLTLLQHHLRRRAVSDWVYEQVYLMPYPKELMLRNHV
jgi:uncharacterized protein YbgA (DUF1722 family)/uncharacterized protein YbbK (DUF523 family)